MWSLSCSVSATLLVYCRVAMVTNVSERYSPTVHIAPPAECMWQHSSVTFLKSNKSAQPGIRVHENSSLCALHGQYLFTGPLRRPWTRDHPQTASLRAWIHQNNPQHGVTRHGVQTSSLAPRDVRHKKYSLRLQLAFLPHVRNEDWFNFWRMSLLMYGLAIST
jgi:hypothetical protein